MSYNTQQDILDFVEDNNVKFVRFAFCDIFGTQKNIAVLASDLPKAMEDGVCFDGSSIAGFMKVEESDLVLRPDLSTVTILPWRPTEGRVMQFFCDVEKPDGAAFGGNCRGFLRQMSRSFRKLVLIVTINEVPGKKIEALGVVRGSTVQSRNLGHDIMAGFRTLVGGEVTDYAEMLTEARQIATGRMAKNAEELGADAVVGMRYASASVMQGAAEVIAYGTAVKFV